MKVTCVVPVYNCDFGLSETLETLLEQKSVDNEIIVVDDGSTDEIAPLKDHYVHKGVKWFCNGERKGGAYSRNFGNAMATGDLIAVCDAGDLYVPDRLQKTVEYFNENSVDVFYSDVQVNDCMKQPVFVQKAVEWDGASKPPISHPTVAYTKGLAMETMYQERSLNTDLYEFFMIDAFNKGYKFGYLNEILCVKLDLADGPDYRDAKKAKELKKRMYKEYKIAVKEA